MINPFRPKPVASEPVARASHDAAPHGHTEAELKAAYDRGRRDEKARHRRSPVLALGLVAAALIGGTSLVLAAVEGSFSEGGALMDRGVSTAAREAVPTLRKGAAAVQEQLSSDAEVVDSPQPAS